MSLLNIPMPDMTRLTYVGAAKLKEEMSRPGGQPEKLDFSIMPSCFNCDAPISQVLGNKVPNISSGVLLIQSWPLSRWSVRLVGLPFTAPKRYFICCLEVGVPESSGYCSVKSQIGKTEDLEQTGTRCSARKIR